MDNRKIGFVLIPDARAVNESIRLNEAIPDNQLKLDKEWHVPHVTVLQTYFRPGFDYKGALKAAREHYGFNREASTLFNGITIQDADRLEDIIWWNIVNAEWLKTLNRKLVELNEEYIIKPTSTTGLKFKNPQAEESFLRTGYSRNLEAYEPHITLGISATPWQPDVSSMSGERVRFHRMCVVEHGPFGEIHNVLASETLPVSWE